MNVNEFIKQLCNMLHINLPKIIYKYDLNGLCINYLSSKKTIYIKKDTKIDYSFLYQTVIAIRYYYQDINKTNQSKKQRLDDALKFAEFYFDKYMNIKLIIDESDITFSKNILK